MTAIDADVAVVGAGGAGLWTTLTAAHAGARVALVSATPLAQTASYWAQGGIAAALGPERGRAEDFWRALFRATYAAEFRVERRGRGDEIVAHDAGRYAELLPLAWTAGGIGFTSDAGELAPSLDAGERARLRRAWARRRCSGELSTCTWRWPTRTSPSAVVGVSDPARWDSRSPSPASASALSPSMTAVAA